MVNRPISYPELIAVLREAQEFLAMPGNDFVWSSWDGAEQGIQELNGHIAGVEAGEPVRRIRLETLFAPTGPLQEVSVSSGWGQEFLNMAKRFDTAMGIG